MYSKPFPISIFFVSVYPDNRPFFPYDGYSLRQTSKAKNPKPLHNMPFHEITGETHMNANEKKEGLYANVEMKVEVTNVCRGGRCRFCSPMFRPWVREVGRHVFLENFEKNLVAYLDGGGRKIILTGGGEPTDAPAKLFGALRIIGKATESRKIELELLTVYTNGVNLLKPIIPCASQTVLDKLVSLGLKDINLSVHGNTYEQRDYVSGEHMASVDFEQLIPLCVKKGIRVMTRTALATGGIDSIQEIERFVGWAGNLGVNIAYFSDLFTLPIRNKETVPGSQGVLTWTDEHRVPYSKLLTDVSGNSSFALRAEYSRHNNQGKTLEFTHRESGMRVMFGDLVIGNESDEIPTYAYMKPDGSMDLHNNARAKEKRRFVAPGKLKAYLRKCRPGRDDLE